MSSMLDLASWVGQSVKAIDTPALVIDLDAMERNLSRMQAYANAQGVKLRPHAKMHKSAELSQLQMQAGAVGVCVQKVSEAAALAEQGVDDIYISNVVTSLSKCEHLAQILRRREGQNALKMRLAVAADSLQGIRTLAQALTRIAPGEAVNVFVEIDVGQARCGIEPGVAAVPLVQEISRHSSLRFAGLQAYHGRAQHLRSAVERREAIAQVIGKVLATKSALQGAGFDVPLVTGAGTGSFIHEATSGVYGELQAGSYLFMDADYASNEQDASMPRFEHALFVKSQVISRHTTSSDDRSIVDAGHKSHAIDSGLPKIWAGHKADWQFFNGGDEHGILRGSALPSIGDVVWLIPGHCDPTVNLHDVMVGVRGGLLSGHVERIIEVTSRGCLA
ncbi:DSD1 family PLP-dependent enzyme [Variovorax sp. PCZ-1]|nr:DSD1 family PLP-dependent enzyme [Variovorax sp. PCZ-1]MBS7808135.1 DSD1 family PLP-dependent enzyme [Variovorax sp. PCZ-1]